MVGRTGSRVVEWLALVEEVQSETSVSASSR